MRFYSANNPQVELANNTTVRLDLDNVYRRHGVKEYVVWRVYDQKIDWFYLQEGKYIKLEPDNLGLIESRIFPELVLSLKAML